MEQVRQAGEPVQEEAREEAAARDAWVDRAQARAEIVFVRAAEQKYPIRPETPAIMSVARNAVQKWCVSKKWQDLK